MTIGRDFLAGFLFGGFLVWLWIIYQRQQTPPDNFVKLLPRYGRVAKGA